MEPLRPPCQSGEGAPAAPLGAESRAGLRAPCVTHPCPPSTPRAGTRLSGALHGVAAPGQYQLMLTGRRDRLLPRPAQPRRSVSPARGRKASPGGATETRRVGLGSGLGLGSGRRWKRAVTWAPEPSARARRPPGLATRTAPVLGRPPPSPQASCASLGFGLLWGQTGLSGPAGSTPGCEGLAPGHALPLPGARAGSPTRASVSLLARPPGSLSSTRTFTHRPGRCHGIADVGGASTAFGPRRPEP